MPTTRSAECNLRRAIQDATENEHRISDEINALMKQIAEKRSENNQIWTGTLYFFRMWCEEMRTRNYSYENCVELFGKHTIVNMEKILELVIERLVMVRDSTFDIVMKERINKNIGEIQKYLDEGCPAYVIGTVGDIDGL